MHKRATYKIATVALVKHEQESQRTTHPSSSTRHPQVEDSILRLSAILQLQIPCHMARWLSPKRADIQPLSNNNPSYDTGIVPLLEHLSGSTKATSLVRSSTAGVCENTFWLARLPHLRLGCRSVVSFELSCLPQKRATLAQRTSNVVVPQNNACVRQVNHSQSQSPDSMSTPPHSTPISSRLAP